MHYAIIINLMFNCLFALFCILFYRTILDIYKQKNTLALIMSTLVLTVYLFVTSLLKFPEPLRSLFGWGVFVLSIRAFYVERPKFASIIISYTICVLVIYISSFITSLIVPSIVSMNLIWDIPEFLLNTLIFLLIYNNIKGVKGIKRLQEPETIGLYLSVGIAVLAFNVYIYMIPNAINSMLYFAYTLFIIVLAVLMVIVYHIHFAYKKRKEMAETKREIKREREENWRERKRNQEYIIMQTKLMEELAKQNKGQQINYLFKNNSNSEPIRRIANEIMGSLKVKRTNSRYKLFIDALCKVSNLPMGEVPNMSKIHDEIAQELKMDADNVKMAIRRVTLEALESTPMSDFEKVCPEQIMDREGNIDTKTFICILSERIKEKVNEETA